MKITVQKTFVLRCILLSLLLVLGIYIYHTNAKNNKIAPITDTRFSLNTIVSITLYDSSDKNILNEAFTLCDKYESVFSRTMQSSELYKLNHSHSTTCHVSNELASLIETGLYYSSISKGAFDISIAPVSQLWDFTSEEPVLPDSEKVKHSLVFVGYSNFKLKNTCLTKKKPENQIDLGAVAKGYIADKIKDYLLNQGVKSALINLGGNILCVGDKNGKPFHIGVQAPFKERNVTLTTLDIKNKSIVTSGIYERCFTAGNQFYHHILNPRTGYPYENDLSSVTILSDKSLDGDALSTTCFALGLKDGLEYVNSRNDIDAIFVDSKGTIHYSKHFKKHYS